MNTFQSVLDAAAQLPTDDRLRLIEALWDSVPADAEIPLHHEWEQELSRRVAAIENGTAKTIPCSTIRDEALARIDNGSTR
jgi:putative addiction module component (TIGR02574 family)